MDEPRDVVATPAKGFIVDMGRWRKVASIDKVIHIEVGLEWQVAEITPLDRKGRRFLVAAVYNPLKYAVETRSDVPAIPEEEPKTEEKVEEKVEEMVGAVMGEDVFSKTQMRKVQAMLDAEHIANRSLSEELSKARDENKALMAELKKARSEKPQVKTVKAPGFAKEKKAQESEFAMLRNCVMSRLSELERFDCKNVRHCAEACGLKERGLDGNKFVRSTIASLLKLGHTEPAGERNGQKTYRLTKKGLDYLKEVRKDENNN